jgi:DNA-binding MarR family transcriptional regulator
MIKSRYGDDGLNYIEKTLGIKVKQEPWVREHELPYVLTDRYDFEQVWLGSVRALFVTPRAKLDQLASLKKQIARIQKVEQIPVVIVLKSISRSRREYMIRARIPFVVPDVQLYLPFMGMALLERYADDDASVDRLSPSAQVLFFYYLYQNRDTLVISEATKDLAFSGMTFTRASRQLEGTGLFTSEKRGVQRVLIGQSTGREMLEAMKPYLISPVRKRIYVDRELLPPGLPASGLSALSGLTALNPPELECFAAYGRLSEWAGTDELMDAETQAMVEIWKYDPTALSKNGMVDVLSLDASLADIEDERVEEALEALLMKLWRDLNGSRT